MYAKRSELRRITTTGVLTALLAAVGGFHLGCQIFFPRPRQVRIEARILHLAADGVSIRPTVKAVKGDAQRLVVEDGATTWVDLNEHDPFNEKTVLRTGLRSMIRIDLGGGIELRIEEATKIGVDFDFDVDRPVEMTMKYGTVNLARDNAPDRLPIRHIHVNTPTGAFRFIGITGGISFRGPFGVALTGSDAWRAGLDGGATRSLMGVPIGLASADPSAEGLHALEAALTADRARNRAMAGTLGNRPQLATPTVSMFNSRSGAVRVNPSVPWVGAGTTATPAAPGGGHTNTTGGQDPIVNSSR